MTREEAIEYLKDMEFSCDASYDKEALQLAVEALKREQQLLEAGYQNATVDFHIGGRLFRAREIAQ